MRFVRILFLALIAFAPTVVFAQREKLPPEDLEIVEKTWPNAQRTATSLRTVLIKEGKGENAQSGDMLDVLYTGKLIDGTIFDQALDPEKPFTFRLGRGQVIEGWDEALQLMKEGERRIVIVPYELGYGTRGEPPKIPRRATLIFDVTLLKIRK